MRKITTSAGHSWQLTLCLVFLIVSTPFSIPPAYAVHEPGHEDEIDLNTVDPNTLKPEDIISNLDKINDQQLGRITGPQLNAVLNQIPADRLRAFKSKAQVEAIVQNVRDKSKLARLDRAQIQLVDDPQSIEIV